MAEGSRVCPHCRRLNGIDEKTCYACGKSLPGPLASSAQGVFTGFSADGVPATKLIAFICLVVYALCMASDAASDPKGLSLFNSFSGVTLIRFGALLGPPIIESEPWRVLSAVFLHASILHIGMNMLSLINLGRALEPHFRSARFVLLYVLSGGLGYVATLWWAGGRAFSVGASGAIFGLMGAYIAALMIRRNPGWQRVFFSNLILAAALAFASGGIGGQIDHAAHLGGFSSGFLLGLLLELEKQPRRRDRVMAVLASLGFLASLSAIPLSARSPIWKAIKAQQEAARDRRDSE
jgi:rhomboid protease GluP